MKFPHRINSDGSIDSICEHCFVTVGSSTSESDLQRLEAEHVCEPARVAYYQTLDLTGKRPPKQDSEEPSANAHAVNGHH